MKLTHAIIIGLSAFALSSCSYLKNVHLLTAGNLEKENFVEAIPFDMRKDLIVVKAQLNDDTTWYEFIFDTGAFNSKIENNLANSLQLKTVTTKSNSTAQGVTRTIEVTQIDSIKFGHTSFYKIGAGKVKYDSQSASPCIAAHGIIGANLMKLAHWKIDYTNQLIYFSDRPFVMEEVAYTLPFERPVFSGTPKVDINVGGRKVQNILFDVGFNGGLVLPIQFAEVFESDEQQIILDRSTSGIYGSNTDSLIVKILPVEIGGYKTTIPVEFSAIGKALLGNEFLKHFDVEIDYKTKTIGLINKKDVKISEPRKFIVGIVNDSTWIVNRTAPELPLSLGDTLRRVNGSQPGDLYRDYCDYFMHINQLFEQDTLYVEKTNGKIIPINLSE